MTRSLTLPRFAVANVHAVTPQLAVGGDLDCFDVDLAMAQRAELIERGVTHVLDVRQELDDGPLWAGAEVTYRWDGIDDAGQRLPAAWFEKIVTWALDALQDPDALLLTHCHMGINRGPSAGYAVLLAQGWDAVEAIASIRAARPVADVWYAEDALAWWHGRSGATSTQQRTDRRRLAQWRRANPLDVVRVIADARARELR